MISLVALILALAQVETALLDWALERGPYGVDVTPDGSVWINVAPLGTRADYAVLADDVRRQESTSPRWRSFWVRGYHRRDPSVRYRESKAQYTINCEDRTISTNMWVAYRADGSTHSTWRGPSASEPIVPGSMGVRFQRIVCTN